MLPKAVASEEKVTLIANTGIQFIDAAATLDLRRMMPGEFVYRDGKTALSRLQYDERTDRHYHPSKPGVAVKSKLTVDVAESAELFDSAWVPVPVLRLDPPHAFANGPESWARARLVALGEVEAGQSDATHLLSLAFDTTLFTASDETKYLAPTDRDVKAGVAYALAHRADESNWYPDLPWVAGWIDELFEEGAVRTLGLAPEEIEREKQRLVQQAHYLNLLALIAESFRCPQIKLLGNAADDLGQPIPVELVLDVGNSRTCGILVEEHPKDAPLSWHYTLELRDLTRPERVCREPFESRIEFAQAAFGKEHWARKSGRSAAFSWPTIARIGPEAARLASRRRGTEGATGLSSPKRYLWDEERFEAGWRFNRAYVRTEIEPAATAAPFCNLIDELGTALYELKEEDRMPVFMPHYSRSSTMMFMLAEVLTQALSQINSVAQRLKMPNADLPRHLRAILLTVPPSMPKQEREIFEMRARQALALVWKAFGWHGEDDPLDDEDSIARAWPPFPKVEVRWDEATCGQVVHLFTEIRNTFAGRIDEFFALAARDDSDTRMTVATIDIGGGTTDLVINDYVLEGQGSGANRAITPVQRFRDGFKVAGDDILLDVIRAVVVAGLRDALAMAGLDDPDALLSRLIGSDRVDVQEGVLRQQLCLQVMVPAGLAVLAAYERYDPVSGAEVARPTFADLLAQVAADPPTDKVLDYFTTSVRDHSDGAITDYALLATPIPLDLPRLHRLFVENKLETTLALQSLCEIVQLYRCDVLLLTGRPSRLPGVQHLLRALLPLPPARILPLHNYRTGAWYPFHRRGRIEDPKTTAAVGAMLCLLGQGRLDNFSFRAKSFRPYSTVRFVGLMDDNMIIKDEDVFYRDIDLDDPDYALPETTIAMHRVMHLGFRQIAAERWAASPLYVLDFADEKARQAVYERGGELEVRLQRMRGTASERFAVAEVQVSGGRRLGRDAVVLRLNTLASTGLGRDQYWLDSGSILN